MGHQAGSKDVKGGAFGGEKSPAFILGGTFNFVIVTKSICKRSNKGMETYRFRGEKTKSLEGLLGG